MRESICRLLSESYSGRKAEDVVADEKGLRVGERWKITLEFRDA